MKRAGILGVVRSDRTFRPDTRGDWIGKCLHCGRRLVVNAEGNPEAPATLEHIVPRAAGGGEALENLAIACARCNNQKGVRIDPHYPRDPHARQIVEKLLEKRRARWRNPEGHDEG